ncbi:hypothetical protein BASA61_004648 [Batrachochytrium salamandrivorans]|nr:hypothetical protein BASA61_004648 [Batrachochytrium salamandrivorans]
MSLRTADLDPQRRYLLRPDENSHNTDVFPVFTLKLTKVLLERLQSNPTIPLEIDMARPSQLVLHIGDDSLELTNRAEDNVIDCYRRAKVNSSEELLYVGRVHQRLFVTPRVDGPNNRIKNMTQSELKAKASKSVVLLGNSSEVATKNSPKMPLKKMPWSASRQRAPTAFKEDPQLEQKLIHFLASCPQNIESIVKKIRLPQPMISGVLQKIARPQLGDGAIYQLVNEAYLNLTPHEWSQYSPSEREGALKNAQIALDSLGIQKDSPEWKAVMEPPLPKSTPPPPIVPKLTVSAQLPIDSFALGSAPLSNQTTLPYDAPDLYSTQYYSDDGADSHSKISSIASSTAGGRIRGSHLSMPPNASAQNTPTSSKAARPLLTKSMAYTKKPIKRKEKPRTGRDSPPLYIANHSLAVLDSKRRPKTEENSPVSSAKPLVRSGSDILLTHVSGSASESMGMPYGNGNELVGSNPSTSDPTSPTESCHEAEESEFGISAIDQSILSDDETLSVSNEIDDFNAGQQYLNCETLYKRQMELYESINTHLALATFLEKVTLDEKDKYQLALTIKTAFEEHQMECVDSDVFGKRLEDLVRKYDDTRAQLQASMEDYVNVTNE